MASAEWMMNRIDSEMRRLRMEAKAIENMNKPVLESRDIRNTGDYVFARYRPFEKQGDSGALLIAKKKSNRKSRYLIKHYYADSAANEFVYTKLAQRIGLKMPDAVLFRISEGEKRKYWHTEYILGTKYLDVAIGTPTYQQIRERAQNWEDFFRFRAMYTMCYETDSLEMLLASDGYIYRVDTSASFVLNESMLATAGITKQIGDFIPSERVKQYIKQIEYAHIWNHCDFKSDLEYLIERYGEVCRRPYMDTFDRFLNVRDDYVDEFLNVLCYFYPDYIGAYYKDYISRLRIHVENFVIRKV